MYSLDEVGLIPTATSDIKHRADINPFVKSPFGGDKLPVFVAPMTCILNANNICEFSRSKFEPILPVVDIKGGLELRRQLPNGSNWCGWIAMTLDEFKHYFCACNAKEDLKYHILIDVANGHMWELYKCVKDAKQEYGKDLVVMVGNIANPETYVECCKARVDYVRVGIGGGSGCTTSVQTGIHASIPWLLRGIHDIRWRMDAYDQCTPEEQKKMEENFNWGYEGINGFRTKVVADGGVNTIAKAIKCLALGADYVMMGQCFAQCKEGTTGAEKYTIKDKVTKKLGIEHLYYGQASTNGQFDRFGELKSNPEGMAKWVPVTYTLDSFATKFEAALRSAMSYCGAHNLEQFIGKVKYEYMSQAEFGAFIK